MRAKFPQNTFVEPQLPNPARDLVRLVIAEAPGADEAEQGKPLVGGSGRVFNSLLRQAGIPRDGLTITNCISCRPPDNVFPTDVDAKAYISHDEGIKAVTQCVANHVGPILRSRRWSRVDLLGAKPLRWVAGRSGSISSLRGSPIDVQGHRGLAIYHPAYLMRDQTMLPVAVNDLKKSLVEPPEHYKPFPSIEDVRAFKFKTFAFDIECPKYRTLGEHAPIEMVGLCGAATEAICVPTTGEYLSELKRIFRDANSVIGHNCLQFDLPKLQTIDVKINEGHAQVWDTMLLQHLVCPDLPHDLEFVGSQFVSKPAWKDDKSNGWEEYCCRDVDVTYQCWRELLPMVRAEGLLHLYQYVQTPLAKICHHMSESGIKLNPERAAEVRERLIKESAELEQVLPEFLRGYDKPVNKRAIAPPGTLGKSGKPVKFITVPATERVIPWRSPTQKQRYFYSDEPGCLGMEPILDVKSGEITTGKMAIAKLFAKTHNPAVTAIGKLNKLDELITTFASEKVTRSKFVHTNFNVHGTSSGRLSSSEPNLQNIPESARCLYVPRHSGWKIVDVDYSNIENRLTAVFAKDGARLTKYATPGYSDYKLLVSRAYGIPEADVIKDNSREAPYGKCKAIVLGINYGLGAKKINKMYDIPLPEVYNIMDVWKQEIRATVQWQQSVSREAAQTGVLTTPFGRKRWFWTSSTYTESLSFLPQSCAADIIFRVMIGLMYERIGWPRDTAKTICPIIKPIPSSCNLLLQVHDSLVFECAPDKVEELVATLKLVMEQPWKELGGYSVPISVKIGDSWGD